MRGIGGAPVAIKLVQHLSPILKVVMRSTLHTVTLLVISVSCHVPQPKCEVSSGDVLSGQNGPAIAQAFEHGLHGYRHQSQTKKIVANW
jgi:hypothetical protein